MSKQHIVVGRHGLPLRVVLLDAPAGTSNCGLRGLEYLLKKCCSQLAVDHDKQYASATLAGDDEVSLSVTHSPSGIDICGPLVDEHAVSPWFGAGSASMSPPFSFVSMVLNLPAVRTLNVAVDGVFGDARQSTLVFLQPPCDAGRRLVGKQVSLNKRSQLSVLGDLHAFLLGVLSMHVRFVVSFLWVVSTVHLVPAQFVGDGGDASTKCLRDVPQRVPLLSQY